MYILFFIYICVYIYMCIYIYIHDRQSHDRRGFGIKCSSTCNSIVLKRFTICSSKMLADLIFRNASAANSLMLAITLVFRNANNYDYSEVSERIAIQIFRIASCFQLLEMPAIQFVRNAGNSVFLKSCQLLQLQECRQLYLSELLATIIIF